MAKCLNASRSRLHLMKSNKNGAFCFATNDINIFAIILPALFFNLTLDVARQKKMLTLAGGKSIQKNFFNCIEFQLLKQLNNYKELWVQLSHHFGEASWEDFFQTTKGFIRRSCAGMTSLDSISVQVFIQIWWFMWFYNVVLVLELKRGEKLKWSRHRNRGEQLHSGKMGSAAKPCFTDYLEVQK